MTRGRLNQGVARAECRGATLIEAVSAIVVLGIAIPPLTGLFSGVSVHSVDGLYQGVGVSYAEALMEEIASKAFEDPDVANGSFGREESWRAAYDDIDDYDGLNNSPPLRLDGTPLDDYGGFTRSVNVDNVTAADPDPATPASDGSTAFKRLKVTVAWTGARGGEVTLTTLRTKLGVIPLNVSATEATAFMDNEKTIGLSLISATGSDVQIASFQLSADSSVPNVKKFELATVPDNWKDIWSDEAPLPTATLTTNKSKVNERFVPANGSAGASLEFADDLGDNITYTLVLNFTNGSSSSLELRP